jgi:hypothetical protein
MIAANVEGEQEKKIARFHGAFVKRPIRVPGNCRKKRQALHDAGAAALRASGP